MYYRNTSPIQLQKNSNNAFIPNINLNLINSLSNDSFLNQKDKQNQLLYQKQFSIPQYQFQLQQEQLNLFQQPQFQQLQNLQQFRNPLVQPSQNEQLQQLKLQQLQKLKQQQEQQQQLQKLRQEQQQKQFQLHQRNQNSNLQQNLPIIYHHDNNINNKDNNSRNNNNEISTNNNFNRQLSLSNSSEKMNNNQNNEIKNVEIISKINRYPRPIFPLLRPWRISLKNIPYIHTNHFTVIDALYERMSDNERAFLSCYEKGDETKITWPFCIKSIKLNGII